MDKDTNNLKDKGHNINHIREDQLYNTSLTKEHKGQICNIKRSQGARLVYIEESLSST